MEIQKVTSVQDFDTFHNLIYERLALNVIGLWHVIRKPTLHFVLNILYIMCVSIIFVYTMTTCIYSLYLPNMPAAYKVECFEMFILFSVSFAYPMINFLCLKHKEIAIDQLKNSFNLYLNEEPDAEHTKLKKVRVEQIRYWTHIFTVMGYVVAILYALKPPLLYIFGSNDEDSNEDGSNGEGSNEIINPYLPLALYVPFNTKTVYGFTAAFFLNEIHLILLYTTFACIVETYLSSLFQLVAQIEIFNYSLLNIHKRAILKWKLDRGCLSTSGGWEDAKEQQKYLYLCLRTSARHHQAILRYNQELQRFIGVINAFGLFLFALITASSLVTIIKDPLGNPALIAYLLNELTGYFQIFLVGQVLTDKSAVSLNSLYSTPWTCFNKSSSSMLNVMMTIARKPIVLKAPFFNADMTLETFGAMMSSSYKLVNLLLSIV